MKSVIQKILGILLLIGLPFCVFARGGDHINNGGGLAEKNVLLALMNLEKYIQTCLNVESCRVTDAERSLLQQIVATLPQERNFADLIRFGGEKEAKGWFIINGEVKLAKTGRTIGSPIYVNTDLLYSKNSAGVYEPLSLPQAVAMLVHEFGHHHGEVSHTVLDVLGLKVSSHLGRLIYSTPLLPLQDQVSLRVLNGVESTNVFPETLLYVSEEVLDLSATLKDRVRCAVVSLPFGIGPLDFTIPGDAPKAVMLHNLHWKSISDQNDKTTFEAEGNLTLDCDGKGLVKGDTRFILRIKFNAAKTIEATGTQWKLDASSLTFSQLRESKLRLLSF